MSTEAAKAAARRYYHRNKSQRQAVNALWRAQNKDNIRIKQREGKRKRKLYAIEYLGGCCAHCKQQYHPAVYEFHHVDPSSKDRDPSKMFHLSLQNLTKELDKCIVLCANCHRYEHHKESVYE